MKEKLLDSNNYLTFGNFNFYKCQTLLPNGTLYLNISASIKEIKDEYNNIQPEIKDNISVKLKLLFNSDDINVYNNYSFNFNDVVSIIKLLKNNQNYIKDSLSKISNDSEKPCCFLKLSLTYTDITINFFNINGDIRISLLVSDKFDNNKVNNIFIYYNNFKEIFDTFNYFVDNYININNMFINKYYNHCIYNNLYNNLKINRILIDTVKQHDSEFIETMKELRESIKNISERKQNDNSIVNRNIDNQRKIIIENINNDKNYTNYQQYNLDNNINNIDNNQNNNNYDTHTISFVSDRFDMKDNIVNFFDENETNKHYYDNDHNINNMDQHVINDNFYENNDISVVQKNEIYYEQDERLIENDDYVIDDNIEIQQNIINNDDVINDNNQFLTNDINVYHEKIYNKDENDINLNSQFDVYIERNEPILKKKLNDIMDVNVLNDDHEIKNNDLKEKYETTINQNNFNFKNNINNIDVIRNRINTFFLSDNENNDTYINLLNSFVFEKNMKNYINNLFDKCIVQKDLVESFIKLVKYYNIISFEKGFVANNDSIYPCEINIETLTTQEKNDFDKLIAFLFVCLLHFNNIKKILVDNNVDVKYGIKDERKTVTNFKLTYGTIIFGYFLNKNFNKQKFIDNCLIAVKEDFFNYDYYNKHLSNYIEFKNFKENYLYDNYKKMVDVIIELNNNIKSKFVDYKKFIIEVSADVYKLDTQILNDILNNNENNKFNILNHTNLNNILLNIIDSKDFSNQNLISLISKIKNDYRDMKNFEEFNKIDWMSLSENTLKTIVAYRPMQDERLKKDVNYFKNVVDNLNYTKKECIDLILENIIEQKITTNTNFNIF